MNPSVESPYDLLPRDVWGEIFTRAKTQDVMSGSLACKSFYELMKIEPGVWGHLNYKFDPSEKKEKVFGRPRAVCINGARPERFESFCRWLEARAAFRPFERLTRSDGHEGFASGSAGFSRLLSTLLPHASPEDFPVSIKVPPSDFEDVDETQVTETFKQILGPLYDAPEFFDSDNSELNLDFSTPSALRAFLSLCKEKSVGWSEAGLALDQARDGSALKTAFNLSGPMDIRCLRLLINDPEAPTIDFSLEFLASFEDLHSLNISFCQWQGMSDRQLPNLRLSPSSSSTIFDSLEVLTLHTVHLEPQALSPFFSCLPHQAPNLRELSFSLLLDSFQFAVNPHSRVDDYTAPYERVNLCPLLASLEPLPALQKLETLRISLAVEYYTLTLQPGWRASDQDPSLDPETDEEEREYVGALHLWFPDGFFSNLAGSLSSLNLAFFFSGAFGDGEDDPDLTVHALDSLLPLAGSLRELRLVGPFTYRSFLSLNERASKTPNQLSSFASLERLEIYGWGKHHDVSAPPHWDPRQISTGHIVYVYDHYAYDPAAARFLPTSHDHLKRLIHPDPNWNVNHLKNLIPAVMESSTWHGAFPVLFYGFGPQQRIQGMDLTRWRVEQIKARAQELADNLINEGAWDTDSGEE